MKVNPLPHNLFHPHHKYPPLGKMVDKKQLVTNMIIAVVTVGLSLLVVIYTSNVAGPIPISVSQTSMDKLESFSVVGKTELVTTPDQLQVTVGVESSANTVVQAKDTVNNTSEAIIDELDKLGVDKDEIKTINYSVRPNYDYQERERKITGYTVSSSLSVKTKELDILNKIIDTATANGANQVSNVSFTTSPEMEQELLKEARKLAIKDAKRNAKELAGLADMKLGKVTNVIENSQQKPMPIAYESMRMMDESGLGGAPTNIQTGTSSYNYSVTLVYETR